MDRRLGPAYHISGEVAQGLDLGLPVVALESAVITHGLPDSENLIVALQLEEEIRKREVIPATIAVLEGKIHVGLTSDEFTQLVNTEDAHKISVRDLATAITQGWSGGTTVAGTMFVAHTAGIRIFATGGIGGVHRRPSFDVSADLPQLASTPMIVVCAGAKAILDLQATLEYLETFSVMVVGYQTNEFPAFYSIESGYQTSSRVNTPQEAAQIAKMHWSLGEFSRGCRQSAVLVVAPPPEDAALPIEVVEKAIRSALREAEHKGIRGQEVTPFLLERVNEITGGASLRANVSLLQNNARLAAEIALQLTLRPRKLMV
jgi:pseudouridine-5'-phosphate glycosidase